MARNLRPQAKIFRRLGMDLTLGAPPKYGFTRRPYAPGQHGKTSQRRLSSYGQQLREKQKAKVLYGVLEKQFYNYYLKAKKMEGNTAENIIQLLETRLDTVVCVSQLAPSQQAARQLVGHGHVMVNDRLVNIPSYQVKVGDKITIRPQSKQKKNIVSQLEKYDPNRQVSWITTDTAVPMATLMSKPTYDEAQRGIEYTLIIEYYSR